MTERFTETLSTGIVTDNVTGKEYNCEMRIDDKLLELLNELHEENQSSKEFIEQLQEELVLFKEAGANMGIDLNAQITALKQENEQLKSRCNDYDKALKTLQDLTDRKLKENEQLKKDIEYYKTERLALFEYLDKKDDLKLELKVEK